MPDKESFEDWVKRTSGDLNCEGCKNQYEHYYGQMFPNHRAGNYCESGQKPHCTCDTCF